MSRCYMLPVRCLIAAWSISRWERMRCTAWVFWRWCTKRQLNVAGHRGSTTEAAELHRCLLKLRRAVAGDPWVDELIGVSPAIQRVRAQIELASQGRTRVLVHGPSGSGREHVARLLHRRASPDSFGQLVPLCCPLLDAELLQTTITALVRQADSLPRGAETGRHARAMHRRCCCWKWNS